jgi:hypothetical protein
MIFNELLEALMCADIPKRARRLVDVQMRFSFGCGPSTFTSLTKSEYAALANLDWSDAHRALQWLLEKRIFEQDERDMKRYRLNKYYRNWLVRVGLRDIPAFKDHLSKMVKKHLILSGVSPDQSGETPDPQPGKSPDEAGSPIWRNTRRPSGETPDDDLAKRQTERVSSSLQSNGCDLLKKKKRKGKENKDHEEVFTYFFCRDLADLLDGHPFFSALKTDADFWNALATAFPDQDISMQINRMTAWLIANPNKRYKNYKRFIQGWLSRAARKENEHGKNRDNSAERPVPFSDIPPELIA